MRNNKMSDERVERILNYLADSILHESDESTFAEAKEMDAVAETSAEYTRSKLREASQAFHGINMRLANLGHTLDSNWQYKGGEYQNTCLNCGSTVSLKRGSHQSQGDALQARCSPSNEYTTSRRDASRK
jgi:hypothetical protein